MKMPAFRTGGEASSKPPTPTATLPRRGISSTVHAFIGSREARRRRFRAERPARAFIDVAIPAARVLVELRPASGEGVASVGAVPGQVVVVALRATSASASHRILAPVRGRNAPQPIRGGCGAARAAPSRQGEWCDRRE